MQVLTDDQFEALVQEVWGTSVLQETVLRTLGLEHVRDCRVRRAAKRYEHADEAVMQLPHRALVNLQSVMYDFVKSLAKHGAHLPDVGLDGRHHASRHVSLG
jgi:predicted nuclease of predicted toxin-antitoxin system